MSDKEMKTHEIDSSKKLSSPLKKKGGRKKRNYNYESLTRPSKNIK